MKTRRVAVRWTLGDVSRRGFEALQLSVWGVHGIWGDDASYAILVHTLPLDRAKVLAGPLPPGVQWCQANGDDIPDFVAPRVSRRPVANNEWAWMFAPPRLSPETYELFIDNTCIVWDVPAALRAWLEDGEASFVLGATLQVSGGSSPKSRRAWQVGIRGFPPGFDVGAEYRAVLARACQRAHSRVKLLECEEDALGLEINALSRLGKVHRVGMNDVSLCSPLPPHRPNLGRCGAQFVSLNARSLPDDEDGASGVERIRQHWGWVRTEVWQRVAPGLQRPLPPDLARMQ